MKNFLEKVGDDFNSDSFFRARESTIKVVRKVASLAFIGMSEQDGADLINEVLAQEGCERSWHPHKFRIGRNTTKSFREHSEQNIRLEKSDIFFIDIGPVFNGHEGDYGETFIFGSDEHFSSLKQAASSVHHDCVQYFNHHGASGHDLYNYAAEQTKKLGFRLNPKMYGHRLGDFPHAIHCKESLGHQPFIPQPDLWVLEIHIVDENNNWGAFFEDLIL